MMREACCLINITTHVVHVRDPQRVCRSLCNAITLKNEDQFNETNLKATCKRCLRALEKYYEQDKKMPQTDYEKNEITERHVVEFDEKKHTIKRIGNFPECPDPWIDEPR